jgi:type IV secretory pathway TraG/TraD family ATPase VirD4
MPASNPLGESVAEPGGPAVGMAGWLAQTALDALLGLAIGAVLARLIRRAHLHWSWALVALAVVLLARSLLGGLAATLGLAALSAAVWGRRWHHQDLSFGADLGTIAAARVRPLDTLRSAILALTSPRERDGTDDWFRGEELIVGCDQRGRAVSISCGGESGGTHTLVVGATGSGKTITQTWIAVRAIGHGMGAIVLDPKGDRGMRDALCRAAQDASRAFIEWTPDGTSVYNPLARGSDTEIADKVLAGERFTEPHYLRLSQRYMGHVIRALRSSGQEVSLQGIVSHLDPERLELLTRSLPESHVRGTDVYLDSLTPRQRSDLAGVRDRLAILAESDVGRWLDPRTEGAEQFDLLEAVLARSVVYFRLDSDRRPLLAQMLGASIVQDLQTTVAALQGRAVPTMAVIDEFSALAAEQVVRLFGHARSSGLSLLLGTQELADLRLPGRESVLDQIAGNLSAVIAHRQVVRESAELITSLAGTRGAWRASRRSDGASTRTRVREGVLDPSEIMRLETGWAAVIVLTGGGAASLARINAP